MLILLISACNASNNLEKSDNWDELKIPYFDFDQVEHYCDTGFVNPHVSPAETNHYKELPKEKQLFYAARFDCDYFNQELADTAFLVVLEDFGYDKSVLPQEKHALINDVFREKSPAEPPFLSMCGAEFLDILVFRKQNKITGLVKVYFMCSVICISGTEADISNFHAEKAFQKLRELLDWKH